MLSAPHPLLALGWALWPWCVPRSVHCHRGRLGCPTTWKARPGHRVASVQPAMRPRCRRCRAPWVPGAGLEPRSCPLCPECVLSSGCCAELLCVAIPGRVQLLLTVLHVTVRLLGRPLAQTAAAPAASVSVLPSESGRVGCHSHCCCDVPVPLAEPLGAPGGTRVRNRDGSTWTVGASVGLLSSERQWGGVQVLGAGLALARGPGSGPSGWWTAGLSARGLSRSVGPVLVCGGQGIRCV